MEDRIELLHQRFSKAGGLDLKAEWRSKLAGADLRNKLTHPKSIPVITIGAAEKAIESVVETIDALYRAIYGRVSGDLRPAIPGCGNGTSIKTRFLRRSKALKR
jgi:hypothetical protein